MTRSGRRRRVRENAEAARRVAARAAMLLAGARVLPEYWRLRKMPPARGHVSLCSCPCCGSPTGYDVVPAQDPYDESKLSIWCWTCRLYASMPVDGSGSHLPRAFRVEVR